MNTFEIFWHNTLSDLLIEQAGINESFLNHEYQYETALDHFLSKFCDTLKIKNDVAGINQITILRVEWQNVKAGLDPTKLEKINRGKSDLKKIYFLKLSQEISKKLNYDLSISLTKIISAKTLIEQIISSIVASKTVEIVQLKLFNDDELLNLWKSMSGNQELLAMKYKVQLSVTNIDIIILMKEIRDNLE